MTKEDLIGEIENAFRNEKYPEGDYIAYRNNPVDYECARIMKNFTGKSWQTIPNEFLFQERGTLRLFSCEGFKYYLPAFMLFSIENFDESDDLAFNIVLNLLLPQEIDQIILAYGLSDLPVSASDKAINNDIIQDQISNININTSIFIDRASRFSKEQGASIKKYLEYMNENHKEEFIDNEPLTAIERYWFQFK